MEELKVLQRQFEEAAKDYRGLTHILTAWRVGEQEPDLKTMDMTNDFGTKIKTWHHEPSIKFETYTEDHILFGIEYIENRIRNFWNYKHWLAKPSYHDWSERAAFDCFKLLVRKASRFLSLLSRPVKNKNDFSEVACKVDLLDKYYYDKENDAEGIDKFSEWIFFLYKFSSDVTYKVSNPNDHICNDIVFGIVSDVKSAENGQWVSYVSSLDDVFLESALLCQRIYEYNLSENTLSYTPGHQCANIGPDSRKSTVKPIAEIRRPGDAMPPSNPQGRTHTTHGKGRSSVIKPVDDETTHSNDAVKMPSSYISCVEISAVIRKRSDAIARSLRAAKYPIIKKVRKCYCDPQHAAVIFPKWKAHLTKQGKM
jgi:hypothetical protein